MTTLLLPWPRSEGRTCWRLASLHHVRAWEGERHPDTRVADGPTQTCPSPLPTCMCGVGVKSVLNTSGDKCYEKDKCENESGDSLAVQWLARPTSTARDMGLIPGQGTKILHAMWHSRKLK